MVQGYLSLRQVTLQGLYTDIIYVAQNCSTGLFEGIKIAGSAALQNKAGALGLPIIRYLINYNNSCTNSNYTGSPSPFSYTGS